MFIATIVIHACTWGKKKTSRLPRSWHVTTVPQSSEISLKKQPSLGLSMHEACLNSNWTARIGVLPFYQAKFVNFIVIQPNELVFWSQEKSGEDPKQSATKSQDCRRRKFRSQTSDNMERWKSRGGKSQRREEKTTKKKKNQRRERVRGKRCRCAKR